MELAIQINRSAEETSCTSCGDAFIPHRGPALFDRESRRPVCRDCGQSHAPNLVRLLELGDAARRFVRTEEYQGTDP